MQTTAIVTEDMLPLLPASEQWSVGDEIEIDFDLQWYGNVRDRHSGGASLVHVEYRPENGHPIDLSDHVEPEITGEMEEDAWQDHLEGYGDYMYDMMKDREFEVD